MEPVSVILGLLYATAVMSFLMLRIKCRRERLWLGIAVGGCALQIVKGQFPELIGPEIELLRMGLALVWLAATVVSIYFTISAFRSRHVDAEP